MTTTTRTAKMLERVRALLAKADSTNFPGEAESFRAKADELMTTYAIEQWQVDDANGAQATRPRPEVRQMDFSWWTGRVAQHEQLWSLFLDTAAHCRCVVALRGYATSAHGGSYKTMPVIGLASDLDYLDMLFTHLMLQMQRQLHPRVDTSKTLGENAFAMRSAGKSMREGRDAMAPLLWDAGMLDLTDAQLEKAPWVRQPSTYPDPTSWRELPSPLQKSLVGRVRRALNDEAKRRETLVPDVHPRVWQRSFAMGFVGEVGTRFRRMRTEQQASTGGSSGSMALAVRDIREQAVDLYREIWPVPESTGTRSRGRAVSREVRFSDRAYGSGKQAGAKADISGHPSKGLGGRKGLPGGQS
jgi:hypothetical protein